jgi:hypothetical protein
MVCYFNTHHHNSIGLFICKIPPHVHSLFLKRSVLFFHRSYTFFYDYLLLGTCVRVIKMANLLLKAWLAHWHLLVVGNPSMTLPCHSQGISWWCVLLFPTILRHGLVLNNDEVCLVQTLCSAVQLQPYAAGAEIQANCFLEKRKQQSTVSKCVAFRVSQTHIEPSQMTVEWVTRGL